VLVERGREQRREPPPREDHVPEQRDQHWQHDARQKSVDRLIRRAPQVMPRRQRHPREGRRRREQARARWRMRGHEGARAVEGIGMPSC